jgi:hypothetical protein
MNAAVKTPAVTFAEAFLSVQKAIKPAIKDTANGAFKGTKYADLSAVWEAVKIPLQDNGFSIIQSPDFEGQDMWLKTTILHVSGEKMEGRYPLRPSKNDPQGYGSALTYARRYSISAMLGVIADEDDDGNAASAPSQAPSQREAIHQPMRPDQDQVDGTKNWVRDQKAGITAGIENGGGMDVLQTWLEKQGGSFDKPKPSSNLDRMKKKFPDQFKDIHQFYITKLNEV